MLLDLKQTLNSVIAVHSVNKATMKLQNTHHLE